MIKLLFIALVVWGAWLLLRHWMQPPKPKPPKPPLLPTMAEQEARAVLGVGPDADADAIRAAHRRLLAGVHPDRGGSDQLAQRVNAARDVLLRRPE